MNTIDRVLSVTFALSLAACSGGGGGGDSSGGCSLPAASTLEVAEAVPAPGATGVSVQTTVALRFNTCLDLTTLGAVSLLRGTTPVPFTPSYDGATATLTLTPSSPLAYSTSYYVTVLGTLRGARGEQTLGWGGTFRTRATPETIPPTTTASPASGRYNHVLDVTLTCADDPGGTGCAETRYTLDGSAPGPAALPYVGPVSIAASATLRFASVDVEGNWETPRSESYVIDMDPPGVVSVFPPDGATEMALDAIPTVTFDEAMAGGTVPSPVFAPRVSGWLSYDPATLTASYRHARWLDCATTYQVTLGASAQDLAGNPLPGPVTWSFTTSSDCDPPVTTPSLEDGVHVAPQAVTLSCDDGAGTGCARIVYTTDGSVPTLTNGTVVEGASAGPIALGAGETLLRFYAMDHAGNREPVREERYAVSGEGFTFVATSTGVARGAGPVPARFTTLPTHGWTYGFFRDRSSGRLWRATARGVAFSDDDVSWTRGDPLRDTYGSILPASSVWADGSLALAGTRDGLFRSLDGGMTWQSALRATWGYEVAQVTDIDGAGKDLFVATTLGLAVSHDRGETWTWRGFPGTRYDDVDLEVGTGQLFAATSAGLKRSSDGGATFATWNTTSAPALPSDEVRAVAVTAGWIHVATALGYVRMGRGPDGAPDAATTLARPCPSGDTSVLEVAAAGSSVYLVTGEPWVSGSTDSFCVSTNGGSSFAPRWFVSADRTSAIASVVHAEGASVYVGYSPGWYLSTDGGATFDPKELPDGIDDLAADGGKLFAATAEGLAVSSDGFRSFRLRTTTHGLRDRNVDRVVAVGGTVYAVTSWGLSLSTDGGTSFTTPFTGFLNPPQCVDAQGSVVFVGADTVLYRSTNGGTSYTQILPPAGQTGFLGGTKALAFRGSTVVLAGRDSVWVSSDGGGTFAQRGAADGLVPYWSSLSLSDAAIGGGGEIWIASSGGAYLSTDGGTTFVRPPAVPDSTSIQAVRAAQGAPVYFGTTSGLAVSTDGGATATWRGVSEGLSGPRAAVYVP